MGSGRSVPRGGRLRGVIGLAVAGLVAGSVVVVGAQAAQAAPATCTGSANIFDVHPDGTMWLYRHNTPGIGGANWSGPQEIGSGWFGEAYGGPGGDIYNATTNDQLHLLHYDVATNTWLNGVTNLGGGDWYSFQTPNDAKLITVDSTGHIFSYVNGLVMRDYDQSTQSWQPSRNGIDLDYGVAARLFSSGPGVLYVVDTAGNLYRSRYDYVSQRWTEYMDKIGVGFNQFTSIFSPGGDVLYAINGAAGAGQMYWYHFNDDTQTWSSGGAGQQIGAGWYSSSHPEVFATTDTCASPSPAPVAPVTPAAPSANPAIQVAGDTPGVPLHYFSRDSAGHIISATDSGSSGLSTQQLGTRTFAGDVVATNADNGMTVAAVDSTGQVWLSWTGGGSSTFPDFVPLGGSMTTIGLDSSRSGAYTFLYIYGLDGNGDLWERQAELGMVGVQFTAWKDVYSGHHLKGPLVGTQYSENSHIFATAADGSTVEIGDSGLVTTISGDDAFVGDLPLGPVTTYLPDGTLSAPIGFGPSYQTLPLLGANEDVQAADEPIGGADFANGDEVLAAVGKDGNLYYANTQYGGVDNNGFGSWTPGASPWTQLPGATPANPPTVVWNGSDTADLVFRGTDGKIYHYSASTTAIPSVQMVFTGGPHS